MWSWTQLTNWEMEIKGKLYSRHLSRRQSVHSLHLTSKPNRHVCEKEGNSRYTLYKVQYSPENSIFSSSFRVLNFYRNRMFQCERKKAVRIWTKKWPSTRLLNEILKLSELITFCVRRYFKKLYVMQSLTWRSFEGTYDGERPCDSMVRVYLEKLDFWGFRNFIERAV